MKSLLIMLVLSLTLCGCARDTAQSVVEQKTEEQQSMEPQTETTTEESYLKGLKVIFHEILPANCRYSEDFDGYQGIFCGDVEIARRFNVPDYEGSMDAAEFFEFWKKEWKVLESVKLEAKDPHMHLYQCELEGQNICYLAFCEEYDGMPMDTILYQVMEDGYVAEMESILKSVWLEREWQKTELYN